MADGKVHVRRDVWELTQENEWHPIIEWYERGVRALKGIKDVNDVRDWIHLANIHGTLTPRGQWPKALGNHDWNACQHGSWFFLPWHRMYLHHFEKIVQAAIIEQDGPEDWALPFWDYDVKRPETLALPPAFRAKKLPSGHAHAGEDNALYVKRLDAMNNGDPLESTDVDLVDDFGGPKPWLVSRFTSKSTKVPTFGGPKTGWSHRGGTPGHLEIEPHGGVHMDVGGLMTSFETAAQDPIFWLHHANIDRLWEAWRNEPGHHHTSDNDWLHRSFTFGRGEVETKLSVVDVEDTTAAPLHYRYEGVPVPKQAPKEPALREAFRAKAIAAAEDLPLELALDDEDAEPELAGASDTEIPVTRQETVRVSMSTRARPPAARALAKGASEPRRSVYLALENVTDEGGSDAARRYVVYVNLPEGADPARHRELRAGRFSTFGLKEASRRDEEHDGRGLTFSFDITDLVGRLDAKGEWDPAGVRVTIVPRGRGGESARGAVKIGRIGIYYG